MKKERYISWPPIASRYFFPVDLINVSQFDFESVLLNYNNIKNIMLKVYIRFNKLTNGLFNIKYEQIPIPHDVIYQLIAKFEVRNKYFLFYLSDRSNKKKITIIGYDNKLRNSIIIKTGIINFNKSNLKNEYDTLVRINNKLYVPKPVVSGEINEYFFIITSFLKGSKLKDININYSIICLIIKISEITPVILKNNIYYTFSHGDFCPWNILYFNGHYRIIDWEFADYYPVGYDLFTFIFQTHYLLSNYSTQKILTNNIDAIKMYFNNYNLNWKEYFIEFIKLKNDNIISINSKKLCEKYKKAYSEYV